MSTGKYNVLTRVSFLVAVLSSMLYGKLGAFDWLALGVGVASAIVAVGTYFYNAGVLEAKSEIEETAAQHAREKTEIVATGDVLVGVTAPHFGEVAIASTSATEREIAHFTSREIQTTLWTNLVKTSRRDRALHDRYVIYYQQVQEVSQQTAELRKRQLFLDEVVQLVDRYSSTCEIEVNLAAGHLTIKPARPTRPPHIKTREEREENDLKLPMPVPSGMIN